MSALVAAGVLLLSGQARAQDASELDLGSLLDQPVSTAARVSQRVADAPAAVTVITAEDIRRMGATTLAEALRMVPGLNLRAKATGSYGVSIRNDTRLTAPRMLVLIDGRQTTFELDGLTLWETFEVALEQVERIEVVRGPGSALYGAGAYDGVISIVTHRAGSGGGFASATLADNRGHSLTAGYGGAWSAFRMDAAVHTRATYLDAATLVGVEDSLVRSDDFVRGNARLGWSGVSGVDVELSTGASAGESLVYWAYGTRPELSRLENHFTSLTYSHPAIFGNAALSGRVQQVTRSMESAVLGDLDNQALHGELSLDAPLGSAHRVMVGTLLRHVASHRGGAAPRESSELLYAAFLQDIWTISPRWSFTGGIRYDHDPYGGGNVSPRAALLFKPSHLHTLRVAAGRAHRHPILLERDSRYPVVLGADTAYHVLGEPGLDPEVITSYEFGYIGSPVHWMTVTADLFYNAHQGHIDLSPVYGESGTAFAFANLHPGRAVGGEASVSVSPSSWLRSTVNYAYVSLAHTGDMAGHVGHGGGGGHGAGVMTTVPAHKWNLEVAVEPISPVQLSATYHYVSDVDYAAEIGHRVAAYYGYTTLPAQGTVHLNAVARLSRSLDASLFVQNLLDTRYRDVVGGEQFGRRVAAKLMYRF